MEKDRKQLGKGSGGDHGQSGSLEPEGGCGAGTETEDYPTTRDL